MERHPKYKTNKYVVDQFYIMMISLSGIVHQIKMTTLYSNLNRNTFNSMVKSIQKFHDKTQAQIKERYNKEEIAKMGGYANKVAETVEKVIDLSYSMSDEEIDEMQAYIDKKYQKWIVTREEH